jgi:hypothetical protein
VIALVCEWGGDLNVGPGGDIGVALLESSIQQRIIRRLLTNQRDYVWHTEYGAGLGSYVGKPYSSAAIEGMILNQLRDEEYISGASSPTVNIVQANASALSETSVTVRYQTIGSTKVGTVVLGLG